MSARDMLSLVLPCRNQADHIGAVLPLYLSPLQGARGRRSSWVVVPNASSDGTEQVVAEIARRDPRVRLVCNPDGGWGLSVRTGLDAATRRNPGLHEHGAH